MGNLNPGGSRSKAAHRVFGASNIKRAIADNLKGKDYSAPGSIATRPHAHSREVARRLRQQQRKGE